MKKPFFCVFLSLCLTFCAAALADGAYSIGYNYTLVVDCGDFTVRLPSVFSNPQPDVYTTDDCRISLTSGPEGDYISPQNSRGMYSLMQKTFAEQGKDYELIDILGYPALVRIYLDDGYAWGLGEAAIHPVAEVFATTGNTQFMLIMESYDTDILTTYLDGILRHITLSETTSSTVYDDTQTAIQDGADIQTPKYDDADYTQEIVFHDFHLFLPSSLGSIEEDALHFFYDSDSSLWLSFFVKNDAEPQRAAFYSAQDELLEQLREGVANNPNRSIVQMDECLGYLDEMPYEDGYLVDVCVSNRKNLLRFITYSDSLDEALELAHGILSHAVAKEIPLEELEQAE